jgi:uncharacterized protein
MRNNKLLVLILIMMLVFAGLVGCGPSGPPQFPAPKGQVNDFADKLEDEAEKKLEQYLVDYKKRSDVEIAVVTTPSLYGLTIEQYSIQLAEKWGVGGKKKDTGVIILIAPSEKKLRIEVGYGLEEKLTDIKCREIIDKVMLPKIKSAGKGGPGESHFTSAALAGVDAILLALGEQSTPFAQSDSGPSPWMILLFVLLIIVVVILKAMTDGGGGGGGYSSRSYGRGGGGWSSSSSSSSSSSFGGGRFGGGGASGGW